MFELRRSPACVNTPEGGGSEESIHSFHRWHLGIFYSLLIVIAASPVPFGSNREWAWSLVAFIVSCLGLAWGVLSALDTKRVSGSLPLAFYVLVFLVCGWAIVQALPIAPLAWTSPLWAMTEEVIGRNVLATISVVPAYSGTATMRLMSYFLVFFLFFQYCRSHERADIAIAWNAVVGVCYATYGLVSHWWGGEYILWYKKTAYLNDLTSTFVNRNSYATYAGLGLICLMARFLKSMTGKAPLNDAGAAAKASAFEHFVVVGWLPLLGIMLIFSALITSHSRAGFISSTLAIVILLLIYFAKRRAKNIRFAGLFGAMSMLAIAYSVSSDYLLRRLGHVSTDLSDRLVVYDLIRQAIEQNLWLGYGYGSFHEMFRLFRSEEVINVFDKAHNTYLENTFELGVIFPLALFAALLVILYVLLRAIVQRRRHWVYPAVGLSATILICVHSMVDFSVQMPAVAYTYSSIMGVALACSFFKSN